jgi:ribA/ribD-fused uncharacterized protein
MKEKFTFFYKNRSPFSQWYQGAPFTLHGIKFRDAETYMMWYKDQLFGGTMEAKILANGHPSEVKILGRQIPNFNQTLWDAAAKHGVYRGNMAKFTQNHDILATMLETHGTTLVEASPVDEIWGIGLSEDDPLAHNRSTWKGTNWLGEVLTDVRNDIVAAYGLILQNT